MMKRICMIPARAGSKRVPKKNVRLLNNKPLVSYAIDAAKQSNIFDQIIVNTDDPLIMKLAFESDIDVYKRPAEFALDSSTNDDFMYDFLKKHECDYVTQLLPTSPLVTADTIRRFIEMYDSGFETLVSVRKIQIECVFSSLPINFDISTHTLPSQRLTPVYSYACGLMAWNAKKFINAYESNQGAYHGYQTKIGYFEFNEEESIDIDNEGDFKLASAVLNSRMIAEEPKYYN